MLVVDDHDLNRELVRTLLERRGYRVLLAASGEEGIEIARRERPSLILLDLAMPGKDGFQTARELRADSALAETPLIAVTAMAMRGDEERAKKAGFDAYVTKPVDRHILETTVERLLKRMA
jgi:CheY-like chemotaxis protein